MKSLFSYQIFFLLILTLSGCKSPEAVSQSQPTSQEQPPVISTQAPVQPKWISEFFIEGDRLSYNGYEIIELNKEAYSREWCYPERTKPCIVPVSYTVIKRDGRVLAKFDDFHYGVGNLNDFVLYPLLGGEGKQLVISQTGPRSGRHYVVDLTSRPRVILDSNDYEVGREEVELLDLDSDGVWEISLPVTAFYMLFNLSMSETPLPMVIFKYDQRARKYLPANHLFQMNPLEGIEEKNHNDSRSEAGRKLAILLDCIYAGKEEAGWAYFEREYNFPDKQEVKARVMGVLKKEPAYKYIHAHRAT